MVMKSLSFFWWAWSNPDYILTMESFVQVTSCDLHVDNKLFERWNYDIMISLNLLFRTLLWFFLYQDMKGNIDWLNCTMAVIISSYLMQILYSQILSVYERWIEVFLFFLIVFTWECAEICWHIWKISISRLLWSDGRKLHGEIQRHSIVITYMLMKNDRC